ncbi:hypothetical protein QBC34DRAFT_380775 [Podospora aff. communis PSN243]|uniref:Uncharacterized protein n=1 Tax=Podospora aff. communis PSN243 TaxID=3040156 RepID=A0AAV9GNH4_9PEZI|nr:hypothetical protein QBC34DRAFT_380775 [Podospora aff. communis PSN243]
MLMDYAQTDFSHDDKRTKKEGLAFGRRLIRELVKREAAQGGIEVVKDMVRRTLQMFLNKTSTEVPLRSRVPLAFGTEPWCKDGRDVGRICRVLLLTETPPQFLPEPFSTTRGMELSHVVSVWLEGIIGCSPNRLLTPADILSRTGNKDPTKLGTVWGGDISWTAVLPFALGVGDWRTASDILDLPIEVHVHGWTSKIESCPHCSISLLAVETPNSSRSSLPADSIPAPSTDLVGLLS